MHLQNFLCCIKLVSSNGFPSFEKPTGAFKSATVLRRDAVWRCDAKRCSLSLALSLRRKKKCIRYIQGEGSCASPPSTDGSLLDSPPSSPSSVVPSPSSKESKPQTEQMQPLSLTMKPAHQPLHHPHLLAGPPPSLVQLENSAAASKTPGASSHNGALEHGDVSSSRQPGSSVASSMARPSALLCHSHSLLPSTAPQPLSLVTKSIE